MDISRQRQQRRRLRRPLLVTVRRAAVDRAEEAADPTSMELDRTVETGVISRPMVAELEEAVPVEERPITITVTDPLVELDFIRTLTIILTTRITEGLLTAGIPGQDPWATRPSFGKPTLAALVSDYPSPASQFRHPAFFLQKRSEVT